MKTGVLLKRAETRSNKLARHLTWGLWLLPALLICLSPAVIQALTVNVVDHDGNAVSGFRWLLEEDNTNHTLPGVAVANSISLDIHKSHAPVITKGRSAGSSASIPIPDSPNAISCLFSRMPAIR